MRSRVWATLVAITGIFCFPCQATPIENAWHTIAVKDSDAALALIETDHPGAARELGDTAFQAHLALAKAHIAERLPKVTDYPSYSALMAGLAADFQDGHIWSNAIVGAQRINSSGILLIRRDGHWVVGVQQTLDGEPDIKDSVLLGCDDKDADTWAFPRIAQFRGDPSLEAIRASAALWLLTDDSNPFLIRPSRCRFAKPGLQPQDVVLHWHPALTARVRTAVEKVMKHGDAGLSVEPFSGGWWIGLDTLDDTAQKVVDLVRNNQAALRGAPMVVIDLRGNGGGDSRYSNAIARSLVGDKTFTAAQVSLPACSGDFWRVSPGVLAAIQHNLERAEADHDAAGISFYRPVVNDMKQAIAAHREFSPSLPVCARNTLAVNQDKAPQSLPPSEMKGRLVLITDHDCFSSCLIAANLFRRLGALHVGEATDRSTRYMEVREEILPSKLRAFSTLQKVSVGLGDYGPYIPEITYPGAFSEDATLKTWIAALADRHHHEVRNN